MIGWIRFRFFTFVPHFLGVDFFEWNPDLELVFFGGSDPDPQPCLQYLAGGVESLPYDEVDNTPGDYMTVFRLDPVPSFHLLGWIPIFLAGSRLG